MSEHLREAAKIRVWKDREVGISEVAVEGCRLGVLIERLAAVVPAMENWMGRLRRMRARLAGAEDPSEGSPVQGKEPVAHLDCLQAIIQSVGERSQVIDELLSELEELV